MNMTRRKQMHNHYKQILVDDLLEKERRKNNIDRQRKDMGKVSASKNQSLQNTFFEVKQRANHTLQPVTFETHQREFDEERRRKAKAKLEGG